MYYLCHTNKGADHLCCYGTGHTADLCLFVHNAKKRFSHDVAQIFSHEKLNASFGKVYHAYTTYNTYNSYCM